MSIYTIRIAIAVLLSTVAGFISPLDARATSVTVAEWNALNGSYGSCSDPNGGAVVGDWECNNINGVANGSECRWVADSLPPSGTCQATLYNSSTTQGKLLKTPPNEYGIRAFDCEATGTAMIDVSVNGLTIPIPVTWSIKGEGGRLGTPPVTSLQTVEATAAEGTFSGEYVDAFNQRVIAASGRFDWVCAPRGPYNWTATMLAFDGTYAVYDSP